MIRLLSLLLCLLLVSTGAHARLAGPQAWQPEGPVRDLAEIRRSGVLRVLVNQSRNSIGEVRGEVIGLEQLRLSAFEQFLNRDAKGHLITLQILPRPKDQLLAALQRGEGDLVAPGELIERDRPPQVSRTRAVVSQVSLVLVTRQGTRRYTDIQQLSGRSLAIPAGSAAGPRLEALNQHLLSSGRAPIVIEWVDATLAVEDVLEMVQAGIYPATIVEREIAERWAKVLPRLHIETALTLGEPADMHWYVRKEASMLQASADRFLATYQLPANQDAAFVRIYRRFPRLQNPLDPVVRQRLETLRPTLQRHAGQQGFDWLELAAVAFKESTLNPAAKGAGGAVGLMQVTPATARGMGIPDPRPLENNVLASVRYLASLRRNYFSSPRLNGRERMAFIVAAYNMGPERVQSLRAEARRRGLNPDLWFFHVEQVAVESIGLGVVRHVNTVNKYYLAYARTRYLLESDGNR